MLEQLVTSLLQVCYNLCLLRACLHGSRAVPVSEILLCSYFYGKNYCVFIWTSGLVRLLRSRLKEGRFRLPGWKFLHINTHKRANLVSGINNCQNNKIVLSSGMKFSHINKRNSSRLPGCLTKPAWLPYKQALRENIVCFARCMLEVSFLVAVILSCSYIKMES